MATNSKIEWTHHTFNPWRGCTKVSEGCKFCYAESDLSVKLHGVVWGPHGARVVKAESGWREPMAWQRAAEKAGERHRVFCASLADVFEGPETMPAGSWPLVCAARQRLLATIAATLDLDWLLLTKRPDGVMAHLREVAGDTQRMNHHPGGAMLAQRWLDWHAPENVWLGTSCENEDTLNKRVGHLLECPAAVRFLSLEPLLGPMKNLRYDWLDSGMIHWVIVGGESGPSARPCNVEWIRSIVGQCKAAGVACFVKQLGAKLIVVNDSGLEWPMHGDEWIYPADTPVGYQGEPLEIQIGHRKGGDHSEWPADLRVRQFPEVTP